MRSGVCAPSFAHAHLGEGMRVPLRWLWVGAAALMAALLLPAAVLAQGTSAVIEGTVQDESGAVLPNVLITITNVDTGRVRTITTSAAGYYRVSNLAPGSYTLKAELEGFAPVENTGIVLNVGQVALFDQTLKLSGVAEVLTVTSEVPQIETSQSDIGGVITNQTIEALPINGRNFEDLALLMPGVRRATFTSFSGLSFNGQRGGQNIINIDGGGDRVGFSAGTRGRISQEAVQEFEVITNRFSAEYGGGGGGVVNVVSKSGTNTMHGSAYIFERADQLDSKNFFAAEEAPFDQQQVGFTVGGPLVQDRTFYFVGYEYQNTDASASYDTIVPNPNGSGSVPFQEDFPTGINRHDLIGKVNHQLGDDNTLVFRYFHDRLSDSASAYVGGIYLPSNSLTNEQKTHSFVAQETAVLSDTTINELTFQYNNFKFSYIPNTQNEPTIFRPSSVSGTQLLGNETRKEQLWELKDTFSFFRPTEGGGHNLKVGGEFVYNRQDADQPNVFQGYFYVPSDDAFDLNDPSTFPTFFYINFGDATSRVNDRRFGVFIQDDWKVNDRLTLNLGLRYDLERITAIRNDNNNIGPRLGLAYDLTGSGRTVLRGGYGIYYDTVVLNIASNQIIQGTAGQGRQSASTGDVDLMIQFFPDAIPLSALELDAPDLRPADPDFEITRNQQMSLGVQHQIIEDLAVTADLIYVDGDFLPGPVDTNPICTLNGVDDGFCSLGQLGERPDPGAGRLQTVRSIFPSRYQAVQLGLNKRLSNRTQFQVSYTLSWLRDGSTEFYSAGRVANQFRPELDYGYGLEDQRHIFVFSSLVQLPYGIDLANIVVANSERPYTARLGFDNNGDSFNNDRPDFSPDNSVPNFEAVPDVLQFTLPDGRTGNLGRNTERTDNFFTWDLRVSKAFSFERWRIEGIFEVFNLTNHTNFNTDQFLGGFSNSLQAADFGNATAALAPRQIQLAARVSW